MQNSAVLHSHQKDMCGVLAICLFITFVSAYDHAATRLPIGWTPAMSEFRFYPGLGIMFRRASQDECQACYAPDRCFSLSVARCLFYSETSKIMKEEPKWEDKDPNPQLRSEVDSLLFSVIEKAKETDVGDCIPFISVYTDCTRENICTGCKTCDCTSNGQWNCTVSQTCRPELSQPTPDHRVLVSVIEKLSRAETTRRKYKRSVEDKDVHDQDIEDDRISHVKLAQWIENEPTLSVHADDENEISEQSYQNPGVELPRTTYERNKTDSKLLKFIVNSLIRDALPGVFKESTFEFENNRVRRWIKNKTATTKATEKPAPKITFEELTDWLNDVHPYINNKTEFHAHNHSLPVIDDEAVQMNNHLNHLTEPTLKVHASTNNPEFLAFDEVYYNIAVNQNQKKVPLETVNSDLDFNMYDDKYYEETITPLPSEFSSTSTESPDVTVTPTTLEQTSEYMTTITDAVSEYYMDEVTEVVVDLLESAKRTDLASGNETEIDMNNVIDNPGFNNLDEIDSINIMKRDVSKVEEVKPIDLAKDMLTTPSNPSLNNTLVGIKDTVLDPLDKVITNQLEEIKELMKIKSNLVSFVNAVKATLNKSNNDSVLSLYKVEVVPYYHEYMRSSNSTLLDKYMLKLKRDVNEVIRDVISIKKVYKHDSEVPASIKFLINTMKRYIRLKDLRFNKDKLKSTRRSLSSPSNTVKSAIINVIELLDKAKPQTDSLEPVSQKAKKILKRIIKKNYVDDFAGTGLRVYDPHYNLTNDLKHIGTQWSAMLLKIENSSVFDQLYNMKRFHVLLSIDIAKMADALTLIDFARNRRMTSVDEAAGEDIMSTIDDKLKKLNNRILEMVALRQVHQKKPILKHKITKFAYKLHTKPLPGVMVPKKVSFLTKIKNLLRTSKKDILKMLHRNVPKSDMVQDLAREQAEEITRQQMQQTMQKWQNNLNMYGSSREKRSANGFDQMRIKNIIPKYLRGKVHMGKKGRNKKNNTNGHKLKKMLGKSKLTTRLQKKHTAKSTTVKMVSTKHHTTTSTKPSAKVTLSPSSTSSIKTGS